MQAKNNTMLKLTIIKRTYKELLLLDKDKDTKAHFHVVFAWVISFTKPTKGVTFSSSVLNLNS